MTSLVFKRILEDRIYKMRNVLDVKAGEYARGSDRLHNFKRVAEIKRITPAEACIDGFCKHLVSILDMVDDLAEGKAWALDIWGEKVGDAINYLILLEALVVEGSVGQVLLAEGAAKDRDDPTRQGMEGL